MSTTLSRLAATILAGLALTACATGPTRHRLPNVESIDAQARTLMAGQDVKGMALAVIDEGRVVHVNAYGYANLEQLRPLTTQTVMYGASLTKTAFAYMVLQLVDERRLDLDRSIAEYLPRPLPEYEDYRDLAGDERWRQLTPRILLNHSSGLANLRELEADGRLRFHFDPGTRYAYSGEGIWVLQLVLEHGLGLNVGAEMQRHVFDRFDMRRTSMSWRADFRSNVADGYGMDGSFEPHDERSTVAAAGSMDTTIADQALMWRAILRGERLSRRSRAELVRPQLAIPFAHQFPTLANDTDPRAAQVGLAAGLGLVTFRDASGHMWFKGGHNEWTGNMVVCQERWRRCVVLLSNSVRAELIYSELVRFILGETAMPWWWEYNR